MNSKQYTLTQKRFDVITGTFTQRKILIVGDVGLDRYTIGEASRLNQEAPVPIVVVKKVSDKLGLAANVADNIHAFGAAPILATLIGRDRYGEELFELLREKRISQDFVLSRDSRRTTLKERIIAINQQVVRVDYEGTNELSEEDERFYWSKIQSQIPLHDAVIIEDYSKGLVTRTLANKIISEARNHGKFVSVDPPSTSHPRYIEYYQGANLVTPNLHETERLSGMEIRSDSDVIKAGNFLLDELACDVLVITQGKDGMTLFTKEHPPLQVPTFARAVYDVSGAGDTVISMLTLAMVSGASLEESALLANFAAGVEVGKPGTATVTVDELWEYMSQIGGLT